MVHLHVPIPSLQFMEGRERERRNSCFLSYQLQYQALGLTDSFDEKEGTANGPANGNEDHLEEEKGGRRGKGEGGKEELFDDPKYVSSSWVKNEVSKAQVGWREIPSTELYANCM